MFTRILTIGTLVFLSAAIPGRGADIYSLIQQGKLDQARREVEDLSRDSARSQSGLYYRALIEPDGRKSAKLLEDALRASSGGKHRSEIVMKLAQYYAAGGEYDRAREVLGREDAPGNDAIRLRALALHQSGSGAEAKSRLETAGKTKLPPDQQKWVALDQARMGLADGKKKAAVTSLQSLAGARNKEIAPVALYLLCTQAIEGGKIDEAARWYNMLNDQFPEAVGLDGLVDRLGSVSAQTETDDKAEKATGTFYSVKVGVFQSTENAAQQAKKFSESNLKVETTRRAVGGQKYSIVYVGRFRSFDEADRARQELEAKTGEQYQVVAR
jgi:tetratricopeptide (TPR) repeat protein